MVWGHQFLLWATGSVFMKASGHDSLGVNLGGLCCAYKTISLARELAADHSITISIKILEARGDF